MALVISEIFRLFVNTLTPDDKYSRRNMQIFWHNFKRFYLKKKTILWIFYWISEMCMNFKNILRKEKAYPDLIITEIIALERDIYLSV